MSYNVQWSNSAIKTADEIIKYLRAEFTEREVDVFLNKIDEIIAVIEINPKLFRASVKKPNVHLAVIKHRSFLIYQIRPQKKQIILLLLFDARQNPKKLKY